MITLHGLKAIQIAEEKAQTEVVAYLRDFQNGKFSESSVGPGLGQQTTRQDLYNCPCGKAVSLYALAEHQKTCPYIN